MKNLSDILLKLPKVLGDGIKKFHQRKNLLSKFKYWQ